ncbi:MAG: hypothetical protein RL521_309 [Bacteroidota bacterium]
MVRCTRGVEISFGYIFWGDHWGRGKFVCNFEKILIVREYNIKIVGLGIMLGLSTWAADWLSAKVSVPTDAYVGLVYMVVIFWALRYYVSKSNIANPNQWIRRAMTSSMLRLLAVLTFLLITLLNRGKADLAFASAYCLYFLLFLLFEMSEKRSNLRPDSNNGPQKENA